MFFKYYFFIGIFFLLACKKPDERSCWKGAGKMSEKRLDLPSFYKLTLKAKLNYVLIQDTSNFVILRGGKNLLNHITWSWDDLDFLVIENTNKCNFLRNQSELVEVEIHFVNLLDLRYEGSEQLNTPDTLHLNAFHFVVLDANGTLNMLLDVDSIQGDVAYGWGNYNFYGKAKVAYLGVRSNGYCDISNLLVSEKLVLNNSSVGDMYIRADQIPISGEISGAGNIYYRGQPLTIDMKYFSTGKLIPY